ncbi:hypothetical protein SAMN04490355_106419 [Pelosinus propionicus DSM 13327]|uniref:Uncharacterized protein n=1 Tax=Pelosinus propionicus DSM 13327 TaxID=1123291 RepID=A0A1I4PIS6_9FIRM|nr:hypothetical protein SAMN04490355_106419 [Pelosinus propionicus DSM 13327]
MDNGMTFEDVCKTLKKFGLNAIEMSGGSRSSRKGEGYSRTDRRAHSGT